MGIWHSQPVEVHNAGDEDYTEVYKEKTITIPAGKFITMKRVEAELFLGTISTPLPNGGFAEKRLKIVDKNPAVLDKALVCNFCSKEFTTKASLDEHLKIHINEAKAK